MGPAREGAVCEAVCGAVGPRRVPVRWDHLHREQRLARVREREEGQRLALDHALQHLVHLELHLEPREDPEAGLAEEEPHGLVVQRLGRGEARGELHAGRDGGDGPGGWRQLAQQEYQGGEAVAAQHELLVWRGVE